MTKNPQEHDVTCGALDPWPSACDCGCVCFDDAQVHRTSLPRPEEVGNRKRAAWSRLSLRTLFARLSGTLA